MNWQAIEWIYKMVLKYNRKIEYLGNDRYKLFGYYSFGEKYLECEYKDTEIHGKYIEWYQNGQKCCEEDYKNGHNHGKCILWNKDGTIRSEYKYRNGKIVK